MKKITIFLVISIGINLSLFAQDYRSVGNGNWNDVTMWQTTNDGTNWISATSYPGQNPGTYAVTIMKQTEIKITASVAHPIWYLAVSVDTNQLLQPGRLIFSSENAVSLTVSGSVLISGELNIDNRNGAKTHTLSVGGGFEVGTKIYDPETYCGPYDFIPGSFQSINQDDKLNVVFKSGGSIDGGPDGIPKKYLLH